MPLLHSELEYLILSMVADGHRSGYAIRLQMNRMEGLRWSSESGSVYRVLRRLTSDGLIVETGKAGVPNRERTEYAITPNGRNALVDWAKADLTLEELALLIDPVRIKARILEMVPVEARRTAISRWMRQNAAYIRQLRKRYRAASSQREMADANTLALAKARQTWLKTMADLLANG